MLSREDVLKAEEIYLSDKGEILIPVAERNVGYRYTKEKLIWEITKRWYSWKVYHRAITGREALDIMEQWAKRKEKQKTLIAKATEFAFTKHKGQVRKGTDLPYIVHPMEVMHILYTMGADVNLLIAGVLHDTVEDTHTTFDEIEQIFGEDVKNLVASNTEDKTKTWDERKKHTIDFLSKANLREQMLIMADKLANIRAISADCETLGDAIWQRFNAPKEKQAWYYSGIIDALYDMQYVSGCEKLYWELNALYKDVFVKYYMDRENDVIYQISENGEVYFFEKKNPIWQNYMDVISKEISHAIQLNANGTPHWYKTTLSTEHMHLITRKQAEFTEDMWNEIK